MRRKFCDLTDIPPFLLEGVLDGRAPLFLSSPHSGNHIPAAALQQMALPENFVHRMEDCHVDRLLSRVVAAGFPLLAAQYSRVYLDLNRAADEFDPGMFYGKLPVPPRVTGRVRQGLGVLPRTYGTQRQIYAQRLPARVLTERLKALHEPWHRAIRAGLEATRARHGRGVLLDMHSMPSLEGRRPAAIVVGDRYGRSAARWMVDTVVEAFEREQLVTVRNTPYAGGFTAAAHGAPEQQMHVIQIEIDRELYMDQETLEPHSGFEDMAAILERVVRRLAAVLLPDALAAE